MVTSSNLPGYMILDNRIILPAAKGNFADPLATRYLGNYPALFHYARNEGAEKILQTRSLLARNILHFGDEDPEEYRHGLRLIVDGFVPRAVDLYNFQPDLTNFRFLRDHGVDVPRLASDSVEIVREEIDRIGSGLPRFEIYVACFSSNGSSGFMADKFGNNSIRFGPLLPLLAYATCRFEYASMISRVSYDDREFISHCANAIYNGSWYMSALRGMADVAPEDRADFAAELLATELMLLAPNIKRPKYLAESEWRLKALFCRDFKWQKAEESHANRSKLGLAPDAEFTCESPRRLVKRLSIDGKAIVNMIKRIDSDGVAHRSDHLDELRLYNSTTQMNNKEAIRLVQERQLS